MTTKIDSYVAMKIAIKITPALFNVSHQVHQCSLKNPANPILDDFAAILCTHCSTTPPRLHYKFSSISKLIELELTRRLLLSVTAMDFLVLGGKFSF